MALIPTFWGLSDMMCGYVGWEEGDDVRKTVACRRYFCSLGVGEGGVGVGVCGRTMAARGMKEDREVSPQRWNCDGDV